MDYSEIAIKILEKYIPLTLKAFKYSKMEFTITERRNRKLIRDGYLYVFKKMLADDVSSWECISRRKGAQCKASIKLSILDEFIGQNNEQTHFASQTQVEVTKAKATIKG